jgi:hypothetical protein
MAEQAANDALGLDLQTAAPLDESQIDVNSWQGIPYTPINWGTPSEPAFFNQPATNDLQPGMEMLQQLQQIDAAREAQQAYILDSNAIMQGLRNGTNPSYGAFVPRVTPGDLEQYGAAANAFANSVESTRNVVTTAPGVSTGLTGVTRSLGSRMPFSNAATQSFIDFFRNRAGVDLRGIETDLEPVRPPSLLDRAAAAIGGAVAPRVNTVIRVANEVLGTDIPQTPLADAEEVAAMRRIFLDAGRIVGERSVARREAVGLPAFLAENTIGRLNPSRSDSLARTILRNANPVSYFNPNVTTFVERNFLQAPTSTFQTSFPEFDDDFNFAGIPLAIPGRPDTGDPGFFGQLAQTSPEFRNLMRSMEPVINEAGEVGTNIFTGDFGDFGSAGSLSAMLWLANLLPSTVSGLIYDGADITRHITYDTRVGRFLSRFNPLYDEPLPEGALERIDTISGLLGRDPSFLQSFDRERNYLATINNPGLSRLPRGFQIGLGFGLDLVTGAFLDGAVDNVLSRLTTNTIRRAASRGISNAVRQAGEEAVSSDTIENIVNAVGIRSSNLFDVSATNRQSRIIQQSIRLDDDLARTLNGLGLDTSADRVRVSTAPWYSNVEPLELPQIRRTWVDVTSDIARREREAYTTIISPFRPDDAVTSPLGRRLEVTPRSISASPVPEVTVPRAILSDDISAALTDFPSSARRIQQVTLEAQSSLQKSLDLASDIVQQDVSLQNSIADFLESREAAWSTVRPMLIDFADDPAIASTLETLVKAEPSSPFSITKTGRIQEPRRVFNTPLPEVSQSPQFSLEFPVDAVPKQPSPLVTPEISATPSVSLPTPSFSDARMTYAITPLDNIVPAVRISDITPPTHSSYSEAIISQRLNNLDNSGSDIVVRKRTDAELVALAQTWGIPAVMFDDTNLGRLAQSYQRSALERLHPRLLSPYGKDVPFTLLDSSQTRIVLSDTQEVSESVLSPVVRQLAPSPVVELESLPAKAIRKLNQRLQKQANNLADNVTTMTDAQIEAALDSIGLTRSTIDALLADAPSLALANIVETIPYPLLTPAATNIAEEYAIASRNFFDATNTLKKLREDLARTDSILRDDRAVFDAMPPLERVDPSAELATIRNYDPDFDMHGIREATLPTDDVEVYDWEDYVGMSPVDIGLQWELPIELVDRVIANGVREGRIAIVEGNIAIPFRGAIENLPENARQLATDYPLIDHRELEAFSDLTDREARLSIPLGSRVSVTFERTRYDRTNVSFNIDGMYGGTTGILDRPIPFRELSRAKQSLLDVVATFPDSYTTSVTAIRLADAGRNLNAALRLGFFIKRIDGSILAEPTLLDKIMYAGTMIRETEPETLLAIVRASRIEATLNDILSYIDNANFSRALIYKPTDGDVFSTSVTTDAILDAPALPASTYDDLDVLWNETNPIPGTTLTSVEIKDIQVGLPLDMNDPYERRRVDSFKETIRESMEGRTQMSPIRLGYFSEEDAARYNTTPGYDVVDGRHRLQALKEMNFTSVRAYVDDNLPVGSVAPTLARDALPEFYHGTKAENIVGGVTVNSPSKELGPGFYVTTNIDEANKYALAQPAKDAIIRGTVTPTFTDQGRIFRVHILDDNLPIIEIKSADDLVSRENFAWVDVSNLTNETGLSRSDVTLGRAIQKTYQEAITESLGVHAKVINRRFMAWSKKHSFPEWHQYIRSQLSKEVGQDIQTMFVDLVESFNKKLSETRGIKALKNGDTWNIIDDSYIDAVKYTDGIGNGSIEEQLTNRVIADRDAWLDNPTKTNEVILEQSTLDRSQRIRDNLAEAVIKQENETVEITEDLMRKENLLDAQVDADEEKWMTERIAAFEDDAIMTADDIHSALDDVSNWCM